MDEKTIVVMGMGLAKLPNPFFDLFCHREGINPFQILSPIVFQLYQTLFSQMSYGKRKSQRENDQPIFSSIFSPFGRFVRWQNQYHCHSKYKLKIILTLLDIGMGIPFLRFSHFSIFFLLFYFFFLLLLLLLLTL